MTPATPRASATVLMVRESDGGPEVYMVRRHPRSRFMANALVFVGGRADQADTDPAITGCCTGLDGGEAARRLGVDDAAEALGYYVTALRECFEEAGLLPAEGELTGATLESMRAELNDGEASFDELLRRHGLTLPLDRLRYLDHWITPEFEHRRYTARFFVCRAPENQQANFDPKELTFGDWFTVPRVLEGNRDGELHLPPPTLTILEGLQGCRAVDELLARAPDHPVPSTMPRPLMENTQYPTLLLPGDHRYEDPASEKTEPLHLLELVDGNWVRTRK